MKRFEYKIGEIFGKIKNKIQSGYNLREIHRADPWVRASPKKVETIQSGALMDRDDFSPSFQLVEIVRPLLHHLPPLGQMRRSVVGASVGIPYGVSQLMFDQIGTDR